MDDRGRRGGGNSDKGGCRLVKAQMAERRLRGEVMKQGRKLVTLELEQRESLLVW